MRIISLAIICAITITLASIASADDLPRFENYPSAVETVKKSVNLHIYDGNKTYRTQLLDATRRKPDFAGHYIVASWGCGAACIMMAAIDAKTGMVLNFPFTVSNWPLSVSEPLIYKINSRLMIVSGDLNEEPGGTHYYEFTGHEFKLIRETK